jgi:hypothetical protein
MNELILKYKDGDEIFWEGQWIPDGPPQAFLKPGVQPDIPFTLKDEDYRKKYYMLSGRYLGSWTSKEACDRSDPYRFARKYISDGKLPWEA